MSISPSQVLRIIGITLTQVLHPVHEFRHPSRNMVIAIETKGPVGYGLELDRTFR